MFTKRYQFNVKSTFTKKIIFCDNMSKVTIFSRDDQTDSWFPYYNNEKYACDNIHTQNFTKTIVLPYLTISVDMDVGWVYKTLHKDRLIIEI